MDSLGQRVADCFSWCRSTEDAPITSLDWSRCNLGEVPSCIIVHEPTLETLDISHNQIYHLASIMFDCQKLQNIDASNNKLTLIPHAIGQLRNLRSLDLSRNDVVALPSSLSRCKQLSKLNLSNCPMKQLPEVVTQVVGLEELLLCGTEVSFLPSSLGRLTNLRILELRDNYLSSLPPSLHNCSTIIRLDLGQNDFTYMPNRVEDLEDLEELLLDMNGMLALPWYIGNLKKLVHLDASENRLTQLPPQIGQCHSLTELSLISNDISSLPDSIGNLSELKTLKIDDNKLTSLPNSFCNLRKLGELHLSQNRLQELPSNIGLLQELSVLLLDKNQLSTLPSGIGSCLKLSLISLENNLLTRIPAEMGHLPLLKVVNLKNNRLKNLPLSMMDNTSIQSLWLVANQSNPKTILIKDRDLVTGEVVATCYLLPQIRETGAMNHREIEELANRGPEEGRVHTPRNERLKIRFSLNPASKKEVPGSLLRVPTPYPKKLRELEKTARTRSAPPAAGPPQSTSAQENVVKNYAREVHAITDQFNLVKTAKKSAVRKRPAPSASTSNESVCSEKSFVFQSNGSGCSETPTKRLQPPPPYDVALLSSTNPLIFHKTPRRDEPRRSDIDSEVFNTLKDSLLTHLPNTYRDSRSEQSIDLNTYQRSEADSAFVEPSSSRIQPMNPHRPIQSIPPVDGTYSALPGIVTEEMECGRSSHLNIAAKVSEWLKTKTRGAVFLENMDEFSHGNMNMYPLENTESGQNRNLRAYDPRQSSAEDQDDYMRYARLSTTPIDRIGEAHTSPVVLEVTLNRSGPHIGCEVGLSDTPGVYVRSVNCNYQCPGLCVGDKILMIDRVNVQNNTPESIRELLKTFIGPVRVMISRQQ